MSCQLSSRNVPTSRGKSSSHHLNNDNKYLYQLTSAINNSEDRRELPTVPQPTHTIEWLARTSFRHRPVRLNVPHVQQRKHTVLQQRKHKVARRRCVQQSQLDTSFIVYWRSNSCHRSCTVYADIGANGECMVVWSCELLFLCEKDCQKHLSCEETHSALLMWNRLLSVVLDCNETNDGDFFEQSDWHTNHHNSRLVYRISVYIFYICILYIQM